MNSPTQPSSTPITAEGAVSLLREALQFFVDRCDSGTARSKTTYAKFKEVLAATDPAYLRAPQDAKAEQAGRPQFEADLQAESVQTKVQEWELEAQWRGMTGALWRRANARQSAPIEAGELPPLPKALSIARDQFGGMIRAYEANDMRAYGQLCRDTARPASSVTSGADALRYAQQLATAIWQQHYATEAPQWKVLPDLYGALSQIDNMSTGLTRATKPASTGSIGDDAELSRLLDDVESSRAHNRDERRAAVADYIARQSVAAPDARFDQVWNDALEEAALICDGVNNHDNPMTAGDCADAIRALKSAAPVQGKASDAEDAGRLFYISQQGLDGVAYCAHILITGGNGDLGDIRSFIDAVRAQQQGGSDD